MKVIELYPDKWIVISAIESFSVRDEKFIRIDTKSGKHISVMCEDKAEADALIKTIVSGIE